jgi:hypothetical protein
LIFIISPRATRLSFLGGRLPSIVAQKASLPMHAYPNGTPHAGDPLAAAVYLDHSASDFVVRDNTIDDVHSAIGGIFLHGGQRNQVLSNRVHSRWGPAFAMRRQANRQRLVLDGYAQLGLLLSVPAATKHERAVAELERRVESRATEPLVGAVGKTLAARPAGTGENV